MAESDDDKSFDATPYRREKAREEGQIARSQDLTQAAVLLAGAGGLLMLGGAAITFFSQLAQRNLGGEAWLELDVEFLQAQISGLLSGLAGTVLPYLLTVMAVGAGSHLVQSGILFLPDKLAPDLTRIDPLKGLARIFSMQGMAKLAFGIFKMALIAAVAYAALHGELDTMAGLAELELSQSARYLTEVLLWTTVKIAVALLILALMDYGFQWWKREQDLRMSFKEVRDEVKQMVGDPQVLQRRRAIMRQMAMGSLSKAVPKADVVISNPTELAIAIQYKPETMQVPVVVAKGAGVLAQRIRRLALEQGIPIVERKPLAQTLYKEVDVNKPIPVKLYAAVAEVLGYVYRLKGKGKG
ncbi:MAG: flagellar biosynthesis protein FlhB [Pirellulales bacterium]